MKFKLFLLPTLFVTLSPLLGCSSLTEQLTTNESIQTDSSSKEDSLVENSIKKISKAIYMDDFESYFELLDDYSIKKYESSSVEKQNEYREKFHKLSEKLRDTYGDSWIDSIRIRNVGQGNGIEYIEGFGDVSLDYDFLFGPHFIKVDGAYILKDGLDQLDDFLEPY